MLSQLDYEVLRASIMDQAAKMTDKSGSVGYNLRVLAMTAITKHVGMKRRSKKEAELFEAIFRVCMEADKNVLGDGFKKDIYADFSPCLEKELLDKYSANAPQPEPTEYKKYAKRAIGMTDIAEVIIRGGEIFAKPVPLCGDGLIFTRIIPYKVELPDFYDKIASERFWLWIYDDRGRKLSLRPVDDSQPMEVWKAGRTLAILNAREF